MKAQSLKKAVLKMRQGGFTLVEVLVVIGILAILLAITLVAINPGQHFQDSRNTLRSSNVSAILDAIYEYESQHSGSAPPSLANVNTTPQPLKLSNPATPLTEVDLCADLVPAEIADLPMDPSAGAPVGGSTPCAAGTTEYDTGYTISKSASSNRFTVSATKEPSGTISVTR